jgi:hypothetical protein
MAWSEEYKIIWHGVKCLKTEGMEFKYTIEWHGVQL